ncbi:MAG: hypothetical protein ACRYFR_14320 [Janthinobacterium lividum]
MADETIDPNYKLFYNLGYATSNFRNTSELLERMIAQAPKRDAEAMRDGRREYNREALRRQADKMTAPPDDRVLSWQKQMDLDVKEGRYTPEAEKELLQKYDAKVGPEISEEKDAEIIRHMIDPPKEAFKGSDRVGEGPALSNNQKKELSDFEAQQRARQITKEAKGADKEQRRDDDGRGR